MFFLYFGSENFSCLRVCSFKCCHQLSVTLTVEMACQNSILRVGTRRRKPTDLKQHPLTVCNPRRNRRKTITHTWQLLLQHSRQFGTRQKHFMIGLESMILTIILKKSSTVLILRLQRGQCHNGTPSSALSWSIATKVIYFILADTNDVVMFFFPFCRASQRYPSFESYWHQHWDFGCVEEYVIGRTNCSCWRCSSGFEGTARRRPMHLTMFLYMPSMICMQILIVSRKRYFFFTIFPCELS